MRIRRNKQSSSSSSSSTSSSSRSHRLRKKQKRLDAICEKEYTRNRVELEIGNNVSGSLENETETIRRSSRVRRAPLVLDLSPPPSKRKRKNENGGVNLSVKEEERFRSSEGFGGWKSRLRSTTHTAGVDWKDDFESPRGKRRLFNEGEVFRERVKGKGKVVEGESEERIGVKSLKGKSRRNVSCEYRGDENLEGKNDKEEKSVMEVLQLDDEQSRSRDFKTLDQCDTQEEELARAGRGTEHVESDKELDKEGENLGFSVEAVDLFSDKLENGSSHAVNNAGPVEEPSKKCLGDLGVEVEKSKQFSVDMLNKRHIKEGRRCSLCGRGTDGKPPKKLATTHTDSDVEVYGGSSSCEEGNYDILDGFGDEPGWLGRLLGPIHDRFGIADVWVHQHCAVWSPEVYFAGLGCLKNVRAALSRGKALKCSRCGRPGATIGCRVDRCPKTYHLPCGRAGGCIFDHRKFLIACNDHRHLFEPYSNNNLQKFKKLKAKKLKLETRKLSHDAWKKDIEAEEKWLENCGEDEEFLKREGKRLNRDILRIAPVYIGGSSVENEKMYQGWESVAGLQNVIQCMKEVVILPLLYPEFFSTIGLTPPRGVLLHGYPGTGKTHVVRALIGSCSRGGRRIAYFARKGADCLGKYVGDAERQLRLLFQVAERSQPSIIFFDEIDGLAPCRTRQQDQTHNSVVSTLLALMDGLKSRGSVIVIGATNRPDAVDPALRRPGRFDREIYFPLPSVKDRAAILSLHTQNWPKPISGSLLNWIAQKTSGFAGADLQALCTQAAMIALKRNCPLQGLMLAAEKEVNNGRHLPLPSCLVEEADWLDALSCAPPPCSRREAGMAANDVVSSPLYGHLAPCLLQPLSYLLVSLFLDERVWLPPFLYKAANIIKTVIISALNQKGKSSDLWWSYLPDLVKEADVATEIEKALSCAGFFISGSSFTSDTLSLEDYDAVNEFELCKANSAGGGAGACSRLLQSASCSGRKPGFRVLITGQPKSGQRHVASCLLHGFVGCVEIQKVDLATISQEGQGDAVEGLTNVLLKCSSKGTGIIYMPRIDLWAMERHHQFSEKEDESCANTFESPVTGGADVAKRTASRAWNSFMEQVDSISISASLMILATSDVPSDELPHRISQFFSSDQLRGNGSSTLEHTMPRFIVEVGGSFDYDMVINSSAAQLSRDLVRQYVQLIHHRSHAAVTHDKNKPGDAIIANADVADPNTSWGKDKDGTDDVISPAIASNDAGPCDGNKIQQYQESDDQRPAILNFTDRKETETRTCQPKETVSRAICSNKTVKGKSNLLLAISSFGYQILRYPHFAELCWTTSKLKDGPCADINGPWKGWPFNTCIIRPDNSLEKTSVGRSSNNLRHRENFGVVRGLIAVGLMAYRGVYSSIREVSFEVRKVLELLVRQLNAKVLAGKDRSRFLYLLSQVAYLEDMVNSWAYTLQSLECDTSVPTVNPEVMPVCNPDGCHASEHNMVGSDVCDPNISQKSSDQLKVAEQSEYIGSNGVLTCPDMPCSSARITTPDETLQKMTSLAQDSYGSPLQTSTSAVDLFGCGGSLHTQNKVDNVEPENGMSGEVLCGSFGPSEKLNGLGMKKSMHVKEGGVCGHNEKSVLNSSCGKACDNYKGPLMEKMAPVSADNARKSGHEENLNITLARNTDVSVSSLSKLICLYSCCTNCLDSVYVLIQKILVHEWKTIGSSWTVEDVHDAVCSCSANILSAVRRLYSVESLRKSEFISKASILEPDMSLCTCSDVDHRQPNGNPYHLSSGNSAVVPLECKFHLKSREVAKPLNASSNSQYGVGLKFFFKDNVLISPDLDKDLLFHCKLQNMCLKSLLEWILMIKQPLN